MIEWPSEIQRLPHGMLHWERPLKRHANASNPKEYDFVEAECGDCGAMWEIRVHETQRSRTGRCRRCQARVSGSNPQRGADHPKYNGAHRIITKGYVDIKLLPGDPWYEEFREKQGKSHGSVLYVAEHRWVAATTIGRLLHRWEQVHHLDMDKTNNDPENLIVIEHRVHNAITALERENFRLQAEVRRLREALASLQERLAA